MQVPEETAAGALCYLTVALAGIHLMMAYNLESGLMQVVGNSVTLLLFLVLFYFGCSIFILEGSSGDRSAEDEW